MCILGCSSRSIYKAQSYGQLNSIPPQSYYMAMMNVLENGTDVNAWNNIRYLFMMYTIINGFPILVLAFISASFSSRFKSILRISG